MHKGLPEHLKDPYLRERFICEEIIKCTHSCGLGVGGMGKLIDEYFPLRRDGEGTPFRECKVCVEERARGFLNPLYAEKLSNSSRSLLNKHLKLAHGVTCYSLASRLLLKAVPCATGQDVPHARPATCTGKLPRRRVTLRRSDSALARGDDLAEAADALLELGGGGAMRTGTAP